jgi:hypothetical protein
MHDFLSFGSRLDPFQNGTVGGQGGAGAQRDPFKKDGLRARFCAPSVTDRGKCGH